MRCKNCLKEIDEFEIFCDDCKRDLKKSSSKKEVKEFQELIQNNAELEHTKELNTLKNLVVNNKKQEDEDEIDSDFADVKPNNKKTILIIVSILFILIIISLILVLTLKKDKNNEEEIVVKTDYQKILNEYGDEVFGVVKNYMNENNEIPTWQQISELITYDKYEIICDKKNIYKDGNIYLGSCKIDNKPIKYTYGNLQEETKEGKEIEIYKIENSDKTYKYITENEPNSTLVGKITCKTDECVFEAAYDKYVVIKENNEYYLYNYENDVLEFGPFVFSNSNEYNLISYNNKLYAILFNLDGSNNIYNVETSKTLKNIKGTLYLDNNLMNQISLMYKYGYIIMDNNSTLNFVNLKTGNVSYSIKEHIGAFIEDTENNIVYMVVYDSADDYSKFKLINSNGKELFNGKYFKHFELYNKNLIVADDSNYYVYDSKLKSKYSSNSYEKILAIYDEYIVLINYNHLELLDLEGNIIVTFEEEWNSNYSLISSLSGYLEKDKLTLTIEDGINGTSFEYYFIPSTKESGVVEN